MAVSGLCYATSVVSVVCRFGLCHVQILESVACSFRWCYAQSLDCVMCSLSSLLCAMFSLSHV